MKISLSDNLRKLRKENGMTQEELAERLNVSVGVVSKWERGASEPEIMSLVEIAEVFRVSVDALIGYNMAGDNPKDIAEKIADLKKERKIPEAVEFADEALVRFPNNLDIVWEAANLFKVANVIGVESCYDKAIALFKKAITLLSQDTEGKYSEMEIRINIALCLYEQNKIDEAIETFKANNACGNSEDILGMMYINEKKDYEEGMQHIAKAMIYLIERFTRIASAAAVAYSATNCFELAKSTCELFDKFTYGVAINPEKPTLFDKINALMMARAAIESDKIGDIALTKHYIQRAFECATKFDASPVQSVDNMLFASDIKNGAAAFDDLGPVAAQSVEDQLLKAESQNPIKMWNELKQSQRKAQKPLKKKTDKSPKGLEEQKGKSRR